MWLRARVPQACTDKLVIFPGSQAIMFNALLALTSPGDVVVTEALTFPGVRAAAARLNVRLVGVAMDGEGARPDALDDAIRKHKPKAVYLVPTQQNPTTATMGPARRKAIAEIIRKRGTILIEDESRPARPQVSPIATLIPERTYSAASMPNASRRRCASPICSRPIMPRSRRCGAACRRRCKCRRSLMVALLTHWLRSGVANDIIKAIHNEAAVRQQLAARFLKGIAFAARPASHHIWMPLPQHKDGADLAGASAAQRARGGRRRRLRRERRRAARPACFARRRAQSRRAGPGAAGPVERDEGAGRRRCRSV